MFRYLLALSATLVLLGGCLSGCSTLNERSIADQKALMDQYVQVAKDMNATLVIQFTHDGKVGFFYNQEVGLDLGADIQATMYLLPDDNDDE